MSAAIGQSIPRVDGRAKVTGAGRYSAEIALDNMAYAVLVGAHVSSGRISDINTSEAEQAKGVLAVLTYHNLGRVAAQPPYRFAANHHNPIEPSATTAVWDGDRLTLYDSTQGITATQLTVAALLGLSPSKVGVITHFIGGGFGCKAMIWPHVTLAALAARHIGRPVKLALSREQMFSSCGHREEQQQQVVLGASREGHLTAFRHHKLSLTSPFDDWAEPSLGMSAQLYACPNYEGIYRLIHANTMTPTFTRGPGETTGMFALECAMDELAYELGLDPLELRLRNHADVDPASGNPWSSKGLKECYQRGAERFGWQGRNPTPRTLRDGNWLIGTGMATAIYPVALFMPTQRARAPVRRRQRRRSGGHPRLRLRHGDGDDAGRRGRARHPARPRPLRVRRHRPAHHCCRGWLGGRRHG